MSRSNLVFKVADVCPPLTDMLMIAVADYLPSHWVLSHIAARRNLRIPVTARLSNGMKMSVILGDLVGEAIRRYGCYEPATVKAVVSCLRSDSVFFDVGAHMGQYTLLASPLCHSVHSFEALPATFDLLDKNIRSNRLANVHAGNFAVSDKCGDLSIYEGPLDNLGTSSLIPTDDGQRMFSVAGISIDHYCETHRVVPDVLKIDVEGAEISVLRGASQVLREKHPTLFVEIAEVNQRQFGFTSEDLIQKLKDFGYSLSMIEDDDPSDGQLAFYNIIARVPGTLIA